MKKLVLSISLVAAATAAILTGCSSDPEVRLSRKGEACQYTNDCSTGLSCLPRPGGTGGVCVTGEFKIAKTAKECALIQCDQPIDCCPAKPSNCADLDEQCKESQTSSGGTSSYYCEQYQAQCVCDATSYSCDNGACKYKKTCKLDTDCPSNACVGGTCAECKTDDRCPNGSTCVSNKCVAGCSLDSDCPNFYRCDDSGQCVEGSCQTDRECVAATGNVEAKCNTTDKRCVVPCQTDLECGSSQEYSFYSCINNECVYTGCDSDKECQFYFGRGTTGGQSSGSPGSSGTPGTPGAGGSNQHIVCRDRVTAQQ